MKINAMTLTNGTLTIIVDSGAQILTARADHPKWNEILDAYKKKDEQSILSLISIKAVIEDYSVGALSVNSAGVTYNGRLIHSIDTERIMAFLKEGLPYQPIANYMVRKMLNPSARAINELYLFLEHKYMPITPEGMIIAYKGVCNDYYSKNGNKQTVVIQGTVNKEGHILNKIGDVIEIERSSCDDDFRNGCSFGLHAGSLSYAKGWADRVVLVEIDPKDVVSVPEDCNCQKLRCCKYKVIGEYTGQLPSHYTNEFSNNTEPVVEDTEDSDIDEYEDEEYSEFLDDNLDSNLKEPDVDFSKIVFEEKHKTHLEKSLFIKDVFNDENVESRVLRVMSDIFGIDKDTISVKTSISKLNLDSLDVVELMMALEVEFGIEIPDESIDNFNNQCPIEDIVNYIKKATSFVKQNIPNTSVPPTPWTDGYNAGVNEKKYPKYILGDDEGADSENHRLYIKGYIVGYSLNHKQSSH